MIRTLSIVTLLGGPLAVQAGPFQITVTGGRSDQTNVVVKFPLPEGDPVAYNVVELPSGGTIPAQIVPPGLTDDPKVKQYMVFILPQLQANDTVRLKPNTVNHLVEPPHFEIVEKKGAPAEWVYTSVNQKRPVLQYFHLPHDPNDHFYTFKPFHNVYDPATGQVMLTNSSAKTSKDGLYPHHRGLFFGFNRIRYQGHQQADTWHGSNNVFSQHEKTLAQDTGEVLARQRVEISWRGSDGQTFATEHREVTVYATKNGTLIDWNTQLTTTLDNVRLDGDPQHAGFHFRANQEVAKNGKQNTYYLRPDGKGPIGETRNWDPKGSRDNNRKTVNLPWNACSFVTGGKRYTVLRINHPDNPKETRGSERDYGRFGDYFEYDLTPQQPLKLKYRLWVQEGEMTVEQCQAMAEAFVHPPQAKASN
ncbi:MAG: DUF6807 family protein [Gemmataceae bacterium]|nr:PmoA family protein [Gemmata sp.]MDW8197845.1 DUF6807 family protein [Gemmataceae bacterium]